MEILNKLKRNKAFLAVLFLLIIVRIAFLVVLHPPLTWIDASQYDNLAWNTLSNHIYSDNGVDPFAGREPGYPLFFLLPIYAVFGHNILAAQIFQLILQIIILCLLFYLLKKYFNKPVAIICCLLFSLYPAFIAYTFEILTETFFTFLILLLAFVLMKAIENKSFKLIILAGFIAGLATLTRSIALFLPIFLFFFFWWAIKNWKTSLKYSIVMFAITILMMTPWVIRSYNMYHLVIFGRMGAGEILWSASYAPWDGEWKGGDVAPFKDLIRGKTALEQELMFRDMFKKEVMGDPIGTLKIWAKKPGKMFLKSEFNSILEKENSFSGLFNKTRFITPQLVKFLFLVLNIFILFFAFMGIFSLIRSSALLPSLFLFIIFYFILFYFPVHPDSRYKLPLLPYIMAFSSVGILSVGRVFHRLILTSFLKFGRKDI